MRKKRNEFCTSGAAAGERKGAWQPCHSGTSAMMTERTPVMMGFRSNGFHTAWGCVGGCYLIGIQAARLVRHCDETDTNHQWPCFEGISAASFLYQFLKSKAGKLTSTGHLGQGAKICKKNRVHSGSCLHHAMHFLPIVRYDALPFGGSRLCALQKYLVRTAHRPSTPKAPATCVFKFFSSAWPNPLANSEAMCVQGKRACQADATTPPS